MRLRADTCEVRQAPGEHSLIIWRQGGPRRTQEEEEEEEKKGKRRGVIFPTVASDPITRSTFVQEIHITARITKEISSCDQAVQ